MTTVYKTEYKFNKDEKFTKIPKKRKKRYSLLPFPPWKQLSAEDAFGVFLVLFPHNKKINGPNLLRKTVFI